MPRKAAAATKSRQTTPHEDDVDKIRDIIFGGQMREYAERFDALEREVTGNIDQLVKQVDKRFADLERSLGNQIQKVADKLATEREQRRADHSTARTHIKDVEKLVHAKATENDSRFSAEVEALQAALESESSTLAELIEKTRAELSKLVAKETNRLEQHKLASKDLAQLLGDMAKNLKGNGK